MRSRNPITRKVSVDPASRAPSNSTTGIARSIATLSHRARAKPRPDDTPIRALARAHRWKRMLDDGKYRSAGDIAEPEGVTRSFVYGLIRLTFLAPDIVEAILDGMPPNGYGAGGVDTA